MVVACRLSGRCSAFQLAVVTDVQIPANFPAEYDTVVAGSTIRVSNLSYDMVIYTFILRTP